MLKTGYSCFYSLHCRFLPYKGNDIEKMRSFMSPTMTNSKGVHSLFQGIVCEVIQSFTDFFR